MKLADELEASARVLREVAGLRDRLKARGTEVEKAGFAMTDTVSVDMTPMEIAICYGAIDKLLEGL